VAGKSHKAVLDQFLSTACRVHNIRRRVYTTHDVVFHQCSHAHKALCIVGNSVCECENSSVCGLVVESTNIRRSSGFQRPDKNWQNLVAFRALRTSHTDTAAAQVLTSARNLSALVSSIVVSFARRPLLDCDSARLSKRRSGRNLGPS
jgi:hypothetical protein